MIKSDPNGHTVTVAGAAFTIHQGTVDGQVVTTITSDQTGTATAAALEPATYCVVETAAPQGFQLQPTYAPSQCVAVGADPSPGQSPTRVTVSDPPSPTPAGELQITEVDSGGNAVTTPGFTFNIRVGSATGQVVARVTTDQTGTAVASALNPSTYCVEETAAPDGWQLQPAYQPSQCVAVAADPTLGSNPATVTVTDPLAPSPAPSPSPSDSATAAPAESPSPAAIVSRPAAGRTEAEFGPLGMGLIGFGLVLLAAGLGMIAVALRRRRSGPGPAPETWYDSRVS